MRYFAILLFLALHACSPPVSQITDTPSEDVKTEELVGYADPFIGTGGHGHTYPGATAPFGMVQVSPDTRLTGWDGCSGYHYSDDAIYGFSHTHLSGTGIADYCDILLTPTRMGIEAYALDPDGEPSYLSPFQKSSEKASPGYYEVYLDEPQVNVQLTARLRYGQQTYTWTHDDDLQIIMDLSHRDQVLDAWIEWIDDYTVVGYRQSAAWASDQRLYFATRFSEPVASIRNADGTLLRRGERVHHTPAVQSSDPSTLADLKYVIYFGPYRQKSITTQTALSGVDVAGALINLQSASDIDQPQTVLRQAQAEWSDQLSKIKVYSQDSDILTNFYTALYHASIAPNVYSDVDGRYRGVDHQIYQDSDYTRHTVYSLWDTYRAAHPLYTLIEPDRVRSFVHDFWQMYEESGDMAMWELAANETYCMIGYHAVPVIVDAYHKGLIDEDPQDMVRAMAAAARLERNHRKIFGESGYLSAEQAGSSVSQTLEYAFDDWCIASMAEAEGMTAIAEEFYTRSQAWKQLLHPEDHMIRPKNRNFFVEPYDPKEVNFHYTEANGWQYNFYYPHDVSTMIEYLGEEKYQALLDTFFTTDSKMTGNHQSDITGLIGQYAHGNEPSHHAAYLYHFLGQPHRSQELVHRILTELYTTQPDGICGNEDCGQMSAWYVLSALGMYSFQPADGNFLLVAPIVDSAHINLTDGKTLRISRSGSGDYVARVLWNGANLKQSYIHYDDIKSGGHLIFEMQSLPSVWGHAIAERPPSRQSAYPISPIPGIVQGERSFWESTTIRVAAVDEHKIFCTTDGSPATSSADRVSGPMTFEESTLLRCIHIDKNGRMSREMITQLKHIAERKTISLAHQYAPQYAASGPDGLIDGLEGGTDFRSGEWQGFQYHNLDATVSLPEQRRVDSVHVSFLQDQNSWVFLPTAVELLYKDAQGKYVSVDKISHDISPMQDGQIKKRFSFSLRRQTDEIKIIGYNMGICPEGHKANGGKAWIFSDEISVE